MFQLIRITANRNTLTQALASKTICIHCIWFAQLTRIRFVSYLCHIDWLFSGLHMGFSVCKRRNKKFYANFYKHSRLKCEYNFKTMKWMMWWVFVIHSSHLIWVWVCDFRKCHRFIWNCWYKGVCLCVNLTTSYAVRQM